MLWFNLELVVERQEKWKYSTKQGRMRFPRIFHAGILCEKLCIKKENWNSFHVCVENFVGNVEKKWNVKKTTFSEKNGNCVFSGKICGM